MVLASDKSLLSWEFSVLRWRSDATFQDDYSYDEYERLTCTKWSANDIIDCHLAEEKFTRMFAALPDARHVVYFYRVKESIANITRLSTWTLRPANFPDASRDLTLETVPRYYCWNAVALERRHCRNELEVKPLARVKTPLLQQLCFCSRTRFHDTCIANVDEVIAVTSTSDCAIYQAFLPPPSFGWVNKQSIKKNLKFYIYKI